MLQKIEEELLERLGRGVYDDIYNYNQEAWNKILKEPETEQELEEVSVEIALVFRIFEYLMAFASPDI